MNYWLNVVLMAVVVAGSAAQEGRNASLGGTWVMDGTRSDKLSSGGKPVSADVTLIIDHRESAVGVRRIVRSGGVEHIRELHYSTDGTEDTNLNFRGSEVKSKSRWSKGQLITKARQKLDSPLGKVDAELTDVWTISADGQTLTIESAFKVPVAGERKRKEVYLKKG